MRPPTDSEPVLLRRRAGLGSLGHPRVVATSTLCGSRLAREAKGTVGPATAWLDKPGDDRPLVFGQQAIEHAVRCPDPYFRLERGWIVRRLAPDCSRIELGAVPRKADQDNWLRAMGWEAANVHLGAPHAATSILADLQTRSPQWLRDAARTMAAAVRKDQEAWAKAYRSRGR